MNVFFYCNICSSFLNWENGNPNNTNIGEADCVGMNQKGRWIEMKCEQ